MDGVLQFLIANSIDFNWQSAYNLFMFFTNHVYVIVSNIGDLWLYIVDFRRIFFDRSLNNA